MKKLRKLVLTLIAMLTVFCGFIFVGCDNGKNKTEIKLSTQNVQIILGEENNQSTIRAFVSNAKNPTVIIDYESADFEVVAQSAKNNATDITITAYRQCTDTNVIVKCENAVASFRVTVIMPISSISPTKDAYYLSYDINAPTYGGSFSLSNSLLNILPSDTNQTDIEFTLSKEIAGISIDNNVLHIASGLSDLPAVIDVKATSKSNEIVSTVLHFNVVKAIDVNQIKLFLDTENKIEKEQAKIEISKSVALKSQSALDVTVVVPYAVYEGELDVAPQFAYGDTGLILDEYFVYNNTQRRQYEYQFKFNFDISKIKSGSVSDNLSFVLSYKDYPEIKASTVNLFYGTENIGVIKLLTYDELTDISCIVNGALTTSTSFDVYTAYNTSTSDMEGLKIAFGAVPSSASKKDMIMKIADTDAFDSLIIKTQSGEINSLFELEASYRVYKFTAGQTFYFLAKDGFEENAKVNIIIESEQKEEISKTFTLNLKQGFTKFGFVEGDRRVNETTYYLECNSDELNTSTVIFEVAPISVLKTDFTVNVFGDCFQVVKVDEEILVDGDKDETAGTKQYKFTIEALPNKTGTGSVKISFATGDAITCNVVVIEKLTSVKTMIDNTYLSSSALGDISYNADGTVKTFALKFGQSLPITIEGNSEISAIVYSFYDMEYSSKTDVYNKEGEYYKFDSIDPTKESFEYLSSSRVINAATLRDFATVATQNVGKVWVKATATGRKLANNKEYEECQISIYFMVEVYVPISSISANTKNIQVYALNEVGMYNSNLATSVIAVELNKNKSSLPTYDKILIGAAGGIYDLSKETFTYSHYGTDIYSIELIEGTVNQFRLTAYSRTYYDVDDKCDVEIGPLTIFIEAYDKNAEYSTWVYKISLNINSAILVNEIETLNVPMDKNLIPQDATENNFGHYIYLTTQNVANDDSETQYTISTKVSPSTALNKKLVYVFIPNSGTNQGILHISEDGFVSVVGSLGGRGIIRLIPQDAVLIDRFGARYYRENSIYLDINIIVADGSSKETAIRVNHLSEINNADLHYVLNNSTDTISSNILDTFNGGLYGKYNSSDIAEVKIENTSMFRVLGSKAIIEDFVLYGNAVQAFVCAENNGTIRNVKIDIYGNDSSISVVNGTSGIDAGGICGINSGTIDNCMFAGSILGTGVNVGGICGINNGQVLNSKVLLYKLKSGSMNFSGTTIGGLVGLMNAKSTMLYSYIKNYGDSALSSNGFHGAIVGNANNGALIKECFAEGIVDGVDSIKAYALIDSSKVNSIIKDSYVLHANGNFDFFITKPTGGFTSGTLTDISQSIPDFIGYGYNKTWSRLSAAGEYVGYPYLNSIQAEQAITSEELENIQIKSTSMSIAEKDGYAVLFFYKVNNTSLTSNEISALKIANTINYYDLFGRNVDNITISVESGTNLITCGSNALQINEAGEVIINLQSKYDLTIEPREIHILITYYTGEFSVSFNGNKLSKSSSIELKKGITKYIETSIETSIVLYNRSINLVSPKYVVDFEYGREGVTTEDVVSASILGDQIGIHSVSCNFKGYYVGVNHFDVLPVNIYLQMVNSVDDKYDELIKGYSLVSLELCKLLSVNGVTVSKSKAEISLVDELVVNTNLYSDKANEKLDNIEIYSLNGVLIEKYNIAGDAVICPDLNMFNIAITKEDSEQLELQYIEKYKVVISANVENKKYFEYGKYIFKFNTTDDEISANVEINLISQEILSVQINNYAYENANSKGGVTFNYEASSIISPNSSSLLDILVYPSYSNYSYITVTSNVVNGDALSLISYRLNSDAAYYTDYTRNFEFIENGVKIYQRETIGDSVSRYYVRAIAPSTAKVNSMYTITVNVYDENGLMYTEKYNINVCPQEKAGLYDENGNTYAVALSGSDITIYMVKEVEQEYSHYTISDSISASVIFNNDWKDYGALHERASFSVHINSQKSFGMFTLKVTTIKYLNGKQQLAESDEIKIYILPFDLDVKTTHIKGTNDSLVSKGDMYFNNELDFTFGSTVVEDSSGEVVYQQFLNNYAINLSDAGRNYSVNGNMAGVGYSKGEVLAQSLYYVNGNSFTPVVKSISGSKNIEWTENEIVSFKIGNDGGLLYIGNKIGEVKLKLEFTIVYPDGTVVAFPVYFTIKIALELNDDEPEQINNKDSFLAIFDTTQEENHYILMNDIYLDDFTPIQDTSNIASLDGNGYQIIINNFDYDETQSSVDFALFRNVSSNTILKNLTVNIYNRKALEINSNEVTEINYAPLAITNSGIITNCHVVSYKKSTQYTDIEPLNNGIKISVNESMTATDITSKIAGFVMYNEGIITNSRVGGESINEYKVNGDGTVNVTTSQLKEFFIDGFGDIAGFVYQNNGHITSSFVSNLKIKNNNSNLNYTTITSAFAVNNATNGIISMSYTKGAKDDENSIHATKSGIETSGISTGFIYSNAGKISDCYSNITLTNSKNDPGRLSSGFIYINQDTGEVSTSLSLSRIINATTTQMNFSGVNDLGEHLNNGKIEKSYYYDQVAIEDNSILLEDSYEGTASLISSVILESSFYGFNFATDKANPDGTWIMTSTGPELVSANNFAVSLRYQSLNTEKNKTRYAIGYEYGYRYNPILIYSADVFNEVFAGVVNKSTSKCVDVATKKVSGNYRIINNISFDELKTETESYMLSSSIMELTGESKVDGLLGKIDGNGFTISNFAIADTTIGGRENFGMFASITNNAIIMNLNVVVGSTNNEGKKFGVEAKYVTNVGTIAGTLKTSKLVNINISSTYENINSVSITGKNVVGGLVGKVIGDSCISNITIKDISVTAATYPQQILYKDLIGQGTNVIEAYNHYVRNSLVFDKISYAGGIVGIFDAYTESEVNSKQFKNSISTSSSNGIMLKVVGVNQISGGTVGGLFGYVGPQTTVQDALYEVTYVDAESMSENKTQSLLSYNGFAGGIAGVNGGYLRQVKAEHEEEWQKLIEDNVYNYYAQTEVDETLYTRGKMDLFYNEAYNQIAIGGLVGAEFSGKIEKSYSKINVMGYNAGANAGAYFAGGIIGLIEEASIEITSDRDTDSEKANLFEVYAFGDVRAKARVNSSDKFAAGGIIGMDKAAAESDNKLLYEKVNAVNYYGWWVCDEQYADCHIAPFSNFVSTEKSLDETCTARHIYNENIYKVDSQSKLKVKVENETISSMVYGYHYLKNSVNQGENFDIIFFGNLWDTNSWRRDDDELWPHMMFGFYSEVIYIENQNDIELMRSDSKGKTFVIRPDNSNGQNEFQTADGINKYIVITKTIAPIASFEGVLRGLDDSGEFGFYYKEGTTLKRAMFLSTNGATFKHFTVDNVDFEGTLSSNAIWVNNAIDTTFSDVIFTNIQYSVSTQTQSSNISKNGVIVAQAKQRVNFSNVKVKFDSSVNITLRTNATYFGTLFAEANLYASSTISAIDIVGNFNFDVQGDSSLPTSYIGVLGGRILNSDSGTKIDINITSSKQTKLTGTFINSSVGGMFGYAEGICVKAKSAFNSSDGARIDLDKVEDSKLGGIVGDAKNVNFESFGFNPNIRVKDAKNVSLGGICGYAADCSITNVTSGNIKINEKEEIEKSGNITISNAFGQIAVGGILGQIIGTSSIENTIIYTDVDVSLKRYDDDDDDIININDQIYNIASLAGIVNGATIDRSLSYGNVYVCDNVDNTSVYVSNYIANANNSTISNVITMGNVYNFVSKIYTNSKVEPDSISIGKKINLYISGLIANISGTSKLIDVASVGNTYPVASTSIKVSSKIDDSGDTVYIYEPNNNNSVNNIVEKLGSICYGGLIANVQGSSNIQLSGRSLNTFFNKLDAYAVDDGFDSDNGEYSNTYKANAVIGNAGSSVAEGEIEYSHVATLTVDNDYGTNKLFGDFIGDESKLLSQINLMIMCGLAISEDVYDDIIFAEGKCKLNPTRMVASTEEFKDKYVYIPQAYRSEGINTESAIKLTGTSHVIADGGSINFNMEDITNDAGQDNVKTAIFKEVSENSIIAGVIANVNIPQAITITHKDGFAGFVNENNGIIYSCVTKKYNGKGNKETGILNAGGNKVSGFAINNYGLIKDSYSNLEISTYLQSKTKTEITMAGFVLNQSMLNIEADTNQGRIISCYSSGYVKNEGSGAKVYLFGPGYCYGCYSICKYSDNGVVKTDSKQLRATFEKDKALNCWYDEVACEYFIESGDSDSPDFSNRNLADSNVALSYFDNNDTFGILNLKYRNSNTNYGYSSFTGGALSNIEYLTNDTGDGSEEKPYQIVNLRKLHQVSGDCQNKNFMLTQNINGKYITEKDILIWESQNISNINKLNGMDKIGGQHEVSNITVSSGGGLFNIAKNVYMSYMNILDITIEDKSISYIGSLANELIDGTVVNCSVSFQENNTNSNDKLILKDGMYYSFFVGKMSEETGASKISNCSLVLKTKNNVFRIVPANNGTSTLGIYVGKLESGIVSNCSMPSALTFEFSSSTTSVRNTTMTIGGIVGEQNDGQVEKCGVTQSLKVFTTKTNCINEEVSVSNSSLYVGGIVGRNIPAENAKTNTISECYTSEKSSVYAGSAYTFNTVYAAGICAYGGKISNCINRGNVEAYAIKTYYNGGANINYDPYMSAPLGITDGYCYTNFSTTLSTDYKVFSHLVFARMIEDAHAAGIANEYKEVKSCVNTATKIRGGLDAQYLHSYYNVSDEYMDGKATGFATAWSFAVGFYATTCSAIALAAIIPGWIDDAIAWSSFGIATGLQIYTLIRAYTQKIDIEQYSFIEGKNQFVKYHELAEKVSLAPFSLENIYDDFVYAETGYILHFGIPKEIEITGTHEISDPSFGFEQDSRSSINKITIEDVDYYYSDNIKVFKSYYDAIGLSSVALHGAVLSSYQIYEFKEEIGSSNYYKFDAVSDVLFKEVDPLINLTQKDVSEWKLDENFTGEFWKDDNGLSLIAEDHMASLTDGNFDVSYNEETEEIEFVVSDELSYNLIVDIVNEIHNYKVMDGTADTWIYDGSSRTFEKVYNGKLEIYDENGLNLSLSEIQSKITSGKYSIQIDSQIVFTDDAKVLGTSDAPFTGKLTSASENSAKLSNVSLKYSECCGLVGYAGNNARISKLVIEYNPAAYLNGTACFGGIIGYAQGSNISISDIELSFAINNYYSSASETKYSNSGSNPLEIGAIAGKIVSTGEVHVSNFTLKQVDIDIKHDENCKEDEITVNNCIAGGLVGNLDGLLEVKLVSSKDIDVNISVNSGIAYAGGFAGFVNQNAKLLVENANIIGGINAETIVANNPSYAGGLFGYINNYNSINCQNITIGLEKSVISNAGAKGITSYAGGLFGFANCDLASCEFKNVQIGVKYSTYKDRMFVMAGMGGKEYSNNAYANIVGNEYSGDIKGLITVDPDTNQDFVKCLSMSRLNYKEYPQANETNFLSSNCVATNLYYDHSSMTLIKTDYEGKTEIDYENTYSLSQFLKIDMYEFPVQIDTNQEVYNYVKTYILVVVYYTYTPAVYNVDTKTGKRTDEIIIPEEFEFKEQVYQINIKSSYETYKDFGLTNDYQISLICASSYSASKNIYEKYTTDAYPINMRSSETWCPKEISKQSITDISKRYNVKETESLENYSGTVRIALNGIELDTNETHTSTTSTTDSHIIHCYDDDNKEATGLFISFNERVMYTELKYRKNTYSNTYTSDSSAYVGPPENGWEDKTVKSLFGRDTVKVYRELDNGDFTYNEYKNVVAGVGLNEVTEYFLVDTMERESISSFDIALNEHVSNLHGGKSRTNSTFKINVFESKNCICVNNVNYKVVIISTFSDETYKDYVYLVNSKDSKYVSNYMGYITYKVEESYYIPNHDFGDIRTSFFFPQNCVLSSYSNNLLPLKTFVSSSLGTASSKDIVSYEEDRLFNILTNNYKISDYNGKVDLYRYSTEEKYAIKLTLSNSIETLSAKVSITPVPDSQTLVVEENALPIEFADGKLYDLKDKKLNVADSTTTDIHNKFVFEITTNQYEEDQYSELVEYDFVYSNTGVFKGYKTYYAEYDSELEKYNTGELKNSYDDKLVNTNLEKQGSSNTYLSYDSIMGVTNFKFGENGTIYKISGEYTVDETGYVFTNKNYTEEPDEFEGISTFTITGDNLTHLEYIKDGYKITESYVSNSLTITVNNDSTNVNNTVTTNVISIADFVAGGVGYSTYEVITNKNLDYSFVKVSYNKNVQGNYSMFMMVDIIIAEVNVNPISNCTSLTEDVIKYYGTSVSPIITITKSDSSTISYDCTDGGEYKGKTQNKKITAGVDGREAGYTEYKFDNKVKFVFTGKNYIITAGVSDNVINLIPYNYTGSYDYLIQLSNDDYYIYSSGIKVSNSGASVTRLAHETNIFGMTATFYQIYNNVSYTDENGNTGSVNEYILSMKYENMGSGIKAYENSASYICESGYNYQTGNATTTEANCLFRSIAKNNQDGLFEFTDTLCQDSETNQIVEFSYSFSAMNINFVVLNEPVNTSKQISYGSSNDICYNSLLEYFMTKTETIKDFVQKKYIQVNVMGKWTCNIIDENGKAKIKNVNMDPDSVSQSGSVYTITGYNDYSIKIDTSKEVDFSEVEVYFDKENLYSYCVYNDDETPASTDSSNKYCSILVPFIAYDA